MPVTQKHIRPAPEGSTMRGVLLPLLVFALLLTGCDWGTARPTTAPSAASPAQGTATPRQAGAPRAIASSTIEGTRPCVADDLLAVAGYSNLGGTMSGGVILGNISATSCSLGGQAGIHVVDASGALLPVANMSTGGISSGQGSVTPGDTPGVVLKQGAKAVVPFVWRNWCGKRAAPYSLAVALPSEGGQLTVPALAADGKPLSETPRCENAKETSTIRVGIFEQR